MRWWDKKNQFVKYSITTFTKVNGEPAVNGTDDDKATVVATGPVIVTSEGVKEEEAPSAELL